MAWPPRLIVFDWDGTLADSADAICSCLRAALADNQLPPISDEELRVVIGLALPEAMRQLLPGSDAPLRQRVADSYRENFFRAADARTRLFADVTETLAALAQRDIWMGVATGKSRRGLLRGLDESGLDRHMMFLRSADDCPSKPHPAMLDEIALEAGVEKHEMLMIGDTEYDLQMANNAAVAAMAVTYGAHDRERLVACEPMACLEKLSDLLGWLDGPHPAAAADGPTAEP